MNLSPLKGYNAFIISLKEVIDLNKIREIADEKNIRISQIVNKTNLSKSFVYDIINEKSYPTIPAGKKIAEALGVTLNDVFPVESKGSENVER